jgi:hypothetical protein
VTKLCRAGSRKYAEDAMMIVEFHEDFLKIVKDGYLIEENHLRHGFL